MTGLEELPPAIWQLTSLKVLSLSGNHLTKLPPELGQLHNLTSLDVTYNQIVVLPPGVCEPPCEIER